MRLQGGPELQARLRAVKQSFKPIGRVWANETARAARPKVPQRTGRLRRSIKLKSATTRRATVAAHFTASFIEAGTVPHSIAPKRGRMLRFEANGQTVFARRVAHPGSRKQPFYRQAAREGLRKAPIVNTIYDAWNKAA